MFSKILEQYLNKLEIISEEHDELTDTDVRERLHEVINWYFIWGNAIDSEFPQKYAMFSTEGDEQVARATLWFIQEASKVTKEVPFGQERNNLIEQSDVQTKKGEYFDLFLGSSDKALPATKPASDDIYSDD